MMQNLSPLTFVWEQFAPYHRDRCEAVAARFIGERRVIGVEFANYGDTYAWAPVSDGCGYEHVTLAPGAALQDLTWLKRLSLLISQLRPTRGPVFLCNYDRPEIFFAALWLRLRRRPVYVMVDSKFDDRPRRLWRECLKALFHMPYRGAMASASRTRDYLRLLGYSASRIALGYDTLSVGRLRRLAGSPPAPEGALFAARQFVVIARFVEKKNLGLAIAAYDAYRQISLTPRGLIMIGSGPLEEALRAEVKRRNLADVRFIGFLQEKGVAECLSQGLALIVPSTEEQWGLVVNEAVAMGLPVLCSENVGARDDLVRVGVNGYVVESDNAEGLAQLMKRIAEDESEWRRLSEGSNALAPRADVVRFADAVAQMIGAGPRS